MDFELRLKALAGLLDSTTEQAAAALAHAFEKASVALRQETRYELLDQALSVLEVIGPRFSEQAADAIAEFTTSVKTRTLTYSDEVTAYATYVAKYRNAPKLIIRSITVLLRLRYLETELVVNALLKLSVDNDEEVRAKALDAMKSCASYDIEVFYGDENQRGIRARPQKEVLDVLSALDDTDLVTYQTAVLRGAEGALSSTMEGTRWSSSAVTFSRAPVPAFPDVEEVRTITIELLKRQYALTLEVSQKISVVNALHEATRPDMSGNADEGVRSMIARNSINVLSFFCNLVTGDEFPVIQKIEAYSYWIFYHASDVDVKNAALEVEAAIARNDEYSVYKTLIGFEGIFAPWEELRKSDSVWDETDRFRKRLAEEFVRKMTAADYPLWRKRIFSYSQVESRDLATFPVFYYFLELLAEAHPEFALELIRNDSDRISAFLIPLLRGLWSGNDQPIIREIVCRWITEGRHLYASAKQFLECPNVDVPLLVSLLRKAGELGDLNTISLVISVVVSNSLVNQTAVRDLFLPALELLTSHHSARWVFDLWYRRESRALLENLDDSVTNLVLDNLVFLEKLDYHGEEILYPIAKRNPQQVVEFFFRRIDFEKVSREKLDQYEAVPYSLQKLNKPLASAAEKVVGTVRSHYDGDYTMFMFRGAQLLKIIFPDFSEDFETELLKIVNSGSDDDIEFVLAVLRNYDGEPFIQRVCRAVVRRLPIESEFWSDVSIALQNTGVVSGEYGFVDAYERKIKEIQHWLDDPSERVKEFAAWYVAQLDKMILAERQRADEQVALRRQRYNE